MCIYFLPMLKVCKQVDVHDFISSLYLKWVSFNEICLKIILHFKNVFKTYFCSYGVFFFKAIR